MAKAEPVELQMEAGQTPLQDLPKHRHPRVEKYHVPAGPTKVVAQMPSFSDEIRLLCLTGI
jgi:hypothetical protein